MVSTDDLEMRSTKKTLLRFNPPFRSSLFPIVLILGFSLVSCASFTKGSFLPKGMNGESDIEVPPTASELWMEGKFDPALALMEKECSLNFNCVDYLKGLLALERFELAAEVADKSCAHGPEASNSHGTCSISIELENHRTRKTPLLVERLRPKCENGDTLACATLGAYLYKIGEKEPSEIPLRNACNAKHLGSCHKLALVLWQDKKEKEALSLFESNCKSKWSRSCRWHEVLTPYSKKLTSIKKKEAHCMKATEEGSCLEAGILKIAANKSPLKGQKFLANACERHKDLESCWETFLEQSENLPAETLKSELSSLCDDGIGNACRNLAELQFRLGKKKEFSELLKKGCQSEDTLSCEKLQELSRENTPKTPEEESG
jgi:hypothetical protein